MANSINSGEKIKYINSVREFLEISKTKTLKVVDEVRAASDNIRTAVTDKIYNTIAGAADLQLIGIRDSAIAISNMSETLSKAKMLGQKLVDDATAAHRDIEPLLTKVPDMDKIPESVIAERGEDENWKADTLAVLNDGCKKFIDIRMELISNISDATTKAKQDDDDFTEVYNALGKALETICNKIVEIFNLSKDAFEQAGIDVSKIQSSAKDVAAATGNNSDAGSAEERARAAAKGAKDLTSDVG